jgi:hypothetical protein
MNINEISEEQYINSNIEKFNISDNITYIGDYAFNNCLNLSKIIIGKNVQYIGDNCFE